MVVLCTLAGALPQFRVSRAVAAVTGLQPALVAARANQVVTVNGLGFSNAAATDPQSLVVASSCALSQSPVLPISVSTVFLSSTRLVLTVNASAVAAGAFRLCGRWASTAAYQDLAGIDVGG